MSYVVLYHSWHWIEIKGNTPGESASTHGQKYYSSHRKVAVSYIRFNFNPLQPSVAGEGRGGERIIISNKVTLLKYCYQHFPNEEDYIFHFLYHKSLNFSKIIFQHFFNKTTGHFCWFPNYPWDKNLFQSGNVGQKPFSLDHFSHHCSYLKDCLLLSVVRVCMFLRASCL